jgi:hypothetical protein
MKLKKYLKYYLPEILICMGFLLFIGCASPSVEVETVESGTIYIKKEKCFKNSLWNNPYRLEDSVVAIIAGSKHGSGFIISQDGYILTAAHVVGNAKSIKVRFTNGREIFSKVLRKSMKEDIALLKIKADKLDPMPLNTNPLKIGSEVCSIANTLTPKLVFGITFAPGNLHAYRNENEIKYIHCDVNVLTGADGGPLVDAFGNAIGVCTNVGFLGERELYNYFLSIEDALNSLDVVVQNGDFVVYMATRANMVPIIKPKLSPYTVKVESIKDKRSEVGRIGWRTAAFDVSMGDIHFFRRVTKYLDESLQNEIHLMGYKIVNAGEDIKISGELHKFWIETHTTLFYWDMVGEIQINIKIDSDKIVFDQEVSDYSCKKTERTYVWPTAKLAGKVLDSCLDDIMNQLREERIWTTID